jgi:hypothetical protein
MLPKFFCTAMLSLLCSYAWANTLPTCLLVSSYHSGCPWTDGVSQRLHITLDGKYAITGFSMDTKRNTGAAHTKRTALQAKALTDKLMPEFIRQKAQPYYK